MCGRVGGAPPCTSREGMEVPAGTRVKVEFLDGAWYGGRVVKRKLNGRYIVAFDDGTREDDVRAAELHSREAAMRGGDVSGRQLALGDLRRAELRDGEWRRVPGAASVRLRAARDQLCVRHAGRLDPHDGRLHAQARRRAAVPGVVSPAAA